MSNETTKTERSADMPRAVSRSTRRFGRQAIKAADYGGAPRVFRRLRARWLRWQKPQRKR